MPAAQKTLFNNKKPPREKDAGATKPGGGRGDDKGRKDSSELRGKKKAGYL